MVPITETESVPRFDPISHTSIRDDITNRIIMSYGPGGDFKSKGNPVSLLDFAFRIRKGTPYYDPHIKESLMINGFTTNPKLFALMRKISMNVPYQGVSSNCVNWASVALWLNGIPNIGIHPFLLYGSMALYRTGMYNVFSYGFQNCF